MPFPPTPLEPGGLGPLPPLLQDDSLPARVSKGSRSSKVSSNVKCVVFVSQPWCDVSLLIIAQAVQLQAQQVPQAVLRLLCGWAVLRSDMQLPAVLQHRGQQVRFAGFGVLL